MRCLTQSIQTQTRTPKLRGYNAFGFVGPTGIGDHRDPPPGPAASETRFAECLLQLQ